MIQAIGDADFKPIIACNPSPAIDFERLLAMNVTSLQFSLDASNARGHDLVRGRGSFEATCEFITRAKRHGVKVNLSVCVTAENRGDVAAFVRLARHPYRSPRSQRLPPVDGKRHPDRTASRCSAAWMTASVSANT